VVSLVIDTSAIVAIVMKEAEAERFIDAMLSARTRVMTGLNLLEAQIVLTFGKAMPGETVEDFIARESIQIVPFDQQLSFGKGRHAARLNMGDCAAYALAKARGWPLLYKGDDFALTDIERA
jgi:ribonuclease VapC